MNKIINKYVIGQVIDHNTKTSTNVSSFGGNSFASARVNVNQSHNTNFFILEQNGKETHISLNGDYPIRVGHHVTVVATTSKSGNVAYYSALHIHELGKIWPLLTNKLKEKLGLITSASTFNLLFILSVIIPMIGLGILTTNVAVYGCFAISCLLLVAFFSKRVKNNIANKKIDKAIYNLANKK